MKSSAIIKWISTLSLFFIIFSVLTAYINLKSVEASHEFNGFIYIQLLFMIIIGSSFVAYFLNWKLLLSLIGIEAKMKDELDLKILDNTKEEIKERKDFEREVEKIISKIENTGSLDQFAESTLSSCCHSLDFVTGIYFHFTHNEFRNIATWAFVSSQMPESFSLGDGLNGQVAKSKKALIVNDLPENYINIYSGTGQGKPKTLYIIPIIKGMDCIAILEFASFKEGSADTLEILMRVGEKMVNNYNQTNN